MQDLPAGDQGGINKAAIRSAITNDGKAALIPKEPQGSTKGWERRPSHRACLRHANVGNLPADGAVPSLIIPTDSRYPQKDWI